MYMGDCNIGIQRHRNGYTVRITDPKIVKQNDERTRDKNGNTVESWRDPQVSYAFSTSDEVVDFIKSNIDKALPVDDFSSTFDKAAKEAIENE